MNDRTNRVRCEHESIQGSSSMAKMHRHDDFELYFLLSGQRRYFLEHTIYDISPGNVVIIPGNQLHRTVNLGNKGYDRYLAYFSQKHVNSFLELTENAGSDILVTGGCFQLPLNITSQIQKSFEVMEQEFTDPCQWTQAAATQLLYNIFLSVMRHGKPKAPCQGESADNIQKVASYISENYANVLTLEDAAQLVHMEKTYFSRRFKALTGFGFLEYLTQTRLRAAEQLLTETDLSVSDIAERSGFTSCNYFGDVFRRCRGISPTEFRIKSKVSKE